MRSAGLSSGSSKEFVNQKDIEKALSLKNPTVTGILKRLDEKGFILAVPSNQDKRCKNIYPTEKKHMIFRKDGQLPEEDRSEADDRDE